LNNKKAYSHSI